MKTKHKLNSTRFILTLGATLVFGAGSPGRAQDYLGASNVLHQVEEQKGTPAASGKKNAAAQLRDDLKSFRESVTNLAPTDAAQRWLDLAGRAVKVQQEQAQSFNSSATPIQADDLLGALPPPTAWSALAKAIAARPQAKSGEEMREAGLGLLAATLTGDSAGRNREIASLQDTAKKANQQAGFFYNNVLQELSQATLAMSDNPDDILKSLGYRMAYGNNQGVQQLQVPNLVSLIGAEKTETFLRKALVDPNVALEFNAPNATSRLAQKLALELMDQLKRPQWGLVNSLDAIALYEALDKRFGVTTNSLASLIGLTGGVPGLNPGNPGDNQKQEAEAYYMLGLISKDRSADAVAVAKKLKGRNVEYMFEAAFKAMGNAGFTSALDDFFNQLLSQDPTLPFWEQYVEVAADAGQTDRMLALVRAATARADLSENLKAKLHQILFKALLAADDVDGAMEQARLLLAMDATSPLNDGYNDGQLGIMLARIGVLLQKPELTEEGITATKKWLAVPAGQDFSSGNFGSVAGALARVLYTIKRGPEAESMLKDALAKVTRPENSQENYGWNEGGPARQILAELATLYHRAGRYDDVLTLLEKSPDWGAKDLSDLSDTSSFDEGDVSVVWLHTPGESPLPIPYIAASSLAATGQKAAAQKIDDFILDRYPGLDRGYELLLALNGTNAIPRLDELFSRDQFEERPLIWKAHLLQRNNQLAEAEKIIRQAIAIDPSDGEEGRGDRMRAYSELVDILNARGHIKDADDYSNVVKSIRLSEDADQFYTAGLLKHAVGMYEQALTYFSDAYCIQSRLAVQLAALGKISEAEQHYRRAYELMPDSFGRVESHCFGCERVFDGERAQSIADKVFTQLVAERPDKPQVHYLLGYLRQEEERYNEALTNYQAAVHLDPDYLNAWVKAQEVSEQTLMPPQERDEIAFNILRLDPLHRHAQAGFERVSDLTALWKAVATAASYQSQPVADLFTLEASKSAMEKKEAVAASGLQAMQSEMMQRMQDQRENLSPASAVAQTPFVRIAGEMILNNSEGGNE